MACWRALHRGPACSFKRWTGLTPMLLRPGNPVDDHVLAERQAFQLGRHVARRDADRRQRLHHVEEQGLGHRIGAGALSAPAGKVPVDMKAPTRGAAMMPKMRFTPTL
jgi:hypothetical protein